MASSIIVASSGPIVEIRIDRPEKKNALTAEMFGTLADALARAQTDAGVRAVLISGSADVFSAGADLRDFLERPPLDPESPVQHFLHALATAEKPLIAAVWGLAVGVGTTLLLHCDIVVAGKSAQFSLPFVDLALVPEAASSLLLPQLIGRRLAFEHLALCEPFDAETALRYGLVNRVVEDAAALATARELAQRVAAKPAAAVRTAKRLIVGGTQAITDRIMEESTAFAAQLKSAEFTQAAASFFSKKRGTT